MAMLRKVKVYWINDGTEEEPYMETDYEYDDSGEYYPAEDVDEQMKEMLVQLKQMASASNYMTQVAFCAIVRNYFPVLADEFSQEFEAQQQVRILGKALQFPDRYGVTGKAKDLLNKGKLAK